MAADAAAEDPGYAEALEQLEAILAELEREEVDVDVLATKVRRAAELIRLCRARITDARMQVDQIVAEFDDLG
jgi:exodeoxyribonuclease VII small subunit